MPRPAINPDVVARIQEAAVENPGWSGPRVYQWASDHVRGCPSKRKVQQIVSDVRRRIPDEPPPDDMPLVAWGPGWPTDDPEAIAFLFRSWGSSLRNLTEERVREPVTAHFTIRQARWLLRLRGLFEGPDDPNDFVLYMYAIAYAIRESVAERLGMPPYFGDLDWAMTLRPWHSDERWTLGEKLGLSHVLIEKDKARVGGKELEGGSDEG